MGGDGGQVIDRATMVRTKGYGFTKGAGDRYANSLGEMANYTQMIQEDRGLGPLERRRVRMTQCFLSQQPLQEPIVACRLGNLYNKEAVIGALLNKSVPSAMSHIRALKDVKPLVVTWAEAPSSEGGAKRMVCPVAREDLDTGGARAVVLWPSGAIISVKTLKEMKLKECPITGKTFDADLDVIPLVPDDEEFRKLHERLPAKKRKAPSAETGSSEAASGKADVADGANSKAAEIPADGGHAAAKKAKTGADQRADGKTTVFKSLLTSGREGGFNGTRDGFGTPAYNRGSNIS